MGCRYPDPDSRVYPNKYEIGSEPGEVAEPETTRIGNSCSDPIVVLQDLFELFGKLKKEFLDLLLVLPELEFPVGEGKQDRFFVFVPRVSPIAGSAKLAVNRVNELAEELVEVDECVGEDIFPKVGWEFRARWVPEEKGLGAREVPFVVVLKIMSEPQVVGELSVVWSSKWNELEVDWLFSSVIRFPFVLYTPFLCC